MSNSTVDEHIRTGKCGSCDVAIPARDPGKRGRTSKFCSKKCCDKASSLAKIADGRYQQELDAAKQKRASEKKVLVSSCRWCSAFFEHKKSGVRFCSGTCSKSWRKAHSPEECSHEGCDHTPTARGLCPKHWKTWARAEGLIKPEPWNDNRRATYHKRRAQKRTTQVEHIKPLEVFERDGWVCGICAAPVNSELSWPDRMSPSLDHIQPLSLGGHHTMENVTVAHLVCNISKGNRVAA